MELFVDHIKRMLTLSQLFQAVPQRRPDQSEAGKAGEVRPDSKPPVVTGQVYLFNHSFVVSEHLQLAEMIQAKRHQARPTSMGRAEGTC